MLRLDISGTKATSIVCRELMEAGVRAYEAWTEHKCLNKAAHWRALTIDSMEAISNYLLEVTTSYVSGQMMYKDKQGLICWLSYEWHSDFSIE